ncbi:hypothetical protein A3I34_01260 [Candidatus Jorgensenbacteria bacterium RIFCSPLOWO2_02_FULL_45_12]|uniref:Uncharacterized protein n=2 Tax=Candidatus Joergenseniibacteriota TaxID=1752739 RepID=A0A1F6BQ41_9BACT|nr:MAG: Glycosyl transferase, group 1 [Candidatus Jorgensenbacteria bacterium GW2011_GWA2_45_9]OGG38963.1 MAG: hypothetical protein A3D55_03050 [Candidatus Jorgensenbacteria bacterium RIFCSPHIGHO2_02_FULL_45_20]OGG42722.1 MAG: hypothetical protein A3I34_01260 [Candidatus Jorgensenbacteria bacterium RIFCSPLOWO2_02_FULL_45_12]
MRVAVLHDYLNQLGGAERVLKSILDIFPGADVYTLLYDEQKTCGIFRGMVKETSFLDRNWIRNRHRAFIPLAPLATRLMRSREKYDLVVSSSAGYAKGIPVDAPCHISYCHTPLRYAWEIEYLKNLPLRPSPLGNTILRPAAWMVARWLRKWDKKAAGRVNVFIANSRFIADKIRAYYGRDAEVVYPPVREDDFYFEPREKQDDYYLMVGRLLYYKCFDVGISAFSAMGKKLVIIGRGPEEEKLKKIANPAFVRFISGVSDSKLRKYYTGARALIFPQVEDFGLVAAEAQMCGLPVLAFQTGGGSEIVENGKTGLLFSEQTPSAIIGAVREFESKKFDRHYIAQYAKKFSEDRFRKELTAAMRKAGAEV